MHPAYSARGLHDTCIELGIHRAYSAKVLDTLIQNYINAPAAYNAKKTNCLEMLRAYSAKQLKSLY